MSSSIYTDKEFEPNEKMLDYDLAEAKHFLDEIKNFIAVNYGCLSQEWKFYSKKSGWILKLFTQKRNVLFIIPCDKHFRTVFTLGERATDLILNSELPESIKQGLSAAKKYAEGRSIHVEVKTEHDLATILEIIKIKLAQ